MKNKWIILVITLLFFIICVSSAFMVHFFSPTITSEISADGMLGYIAATISSISTIALAIVALLQTGKANEMSEHLMEIDDNRYRLEVRPFVMISDWKAYKKITRDIYFESNSLAIQVGNINEKEEAMCLEFIFQNTTDSFEQLSYWTCNEKEGDLKWINCASNQNNLKLRLKPNEEKSIVFYANVSFFEKQIGNWMTLELIFENRFAERYIEKIDILITSLKLINSETQFEKWDFMLFAQNYKIGKFAGEEIKWE